MQNASSVLEDTYQVLEQIQNLYIQPFSDHVVPFIQQAAANVTIRPSSSFENLELDMVDAAKRKLQRQIHATFAHCIPAQRYAKTLSYVLYDAACKLFRLYIRHDGTVSDSTDPEDTTEIRKRMMTLLVGLERVGLGQNNAQRALAHTVNKLLDTHIGSHYSKVDWYGKQPVTTPIKRWIENGLIPFTELILECLRCESASISPIQRKQWQEMALARLGRSRVEDLFDFVTNWDQSLGAILDLKVKLTPHDPCLAVDSP